MSVYATVTLVVEIDANQPWSDQETMANVRRQAVKYLTEEVNQALVNRRIRARIMKVEGVRLLVEGTDNGEGESP